MTRNDSDPGAACGFAGGGEPPQAAPGASDPRHLTAFRTGAISGPFDSETVRSHGSWNLCVLAAL